MQKWEYLTVFFHAEAEKQLEELKQRFPSEKNFLPFSPRALVPQLEKYGEEGWELVSIEPVFMGERGDILLFPQTGWAQQGLHNPWTHTYFCAFKRPKDS